MPERKSWSSFGQEQPVTRVELQKELFEVCERTSRAWLDRMKSDLNLWLGLVAKFAATGSIPELMEAYQKCVAERTQRNAEDTKQLFDDCQRIMQLIARKCSTPNK
jgi:hypothetical protein